MKAVPAKSVPLLIAAILLAGCSSGGGGTVAPTTAATTTAGGVAVAPAAAATITVKDFAYGAPLTVAPGAVVAIVNTDAAGHTVTADQGQAFDVDVKGGGGTASFTAPSAPGTYPYHCTYHPNMHGTLIVK